VTPSQVDTHAAPEDLTGAVSIRPMLSFLPRPVLFVMMSLGLALNLVFWCVALFYPLLLLRLALSFTPLREHLASLLVKIGEQWIHGNNLLMALMLDLSWDVQIEGELRTDESYLVGCNHQSWIDILVLQRTLASVAPFPRFFIKQQLIWVPLLGLVWWGLDFPFMKRYGREYLEKHPEKRGMDMEATRRACAHFKVRPVTLINFFEGTRFTDGKQRSQQSPYAQLLRPKAGGAAFALAAMDGAIEKLLDVTIHYPTGRTRFLDLLFDRVKAIRVHVRVLDIPQALLQGDYAEDAKYRERFQDWVTEMWQEKQRTLERLGAA